MTPPEQSAIAELALTCAACPTQWQGNLVDGQEIYIRWRHGRLTVGIGPTVQAAVKDSIAQTRLWETDEGEGDLDEMLGITGLEFAPGVEIIDASDPYEPGYRS